MAWPERAPSRQSGIGGVKGHHMNEISSLGSPAPWAGSFTSVLKLILRMKELYIDRGGVSIDPANTNKRDPGGRRTDRRGQKIGGN
jgi:hypothetical protein